MKGVDIVSFVMDRGVSNISDNFDLYKNVESLFKKQHLNLNAIAKLYIYNQSTKQKQIPVEMMNREFNPAGDLEVNFSSDFATSSGIVLEKYSQLALDQLLRSI